jgi:hypothetical protein
VGYNEGDPVGVIAKGAGVIDQAVSVCHNGDSVSREHSLIVCQSAISKKCRNNPRTKTGK